MGARTWHWLRIRIEGLLELPPTWSPDGRAFPPTRIGMVVSPPPPPKKQPTT